MLAQGGEETLFERSEIPMVSAICLFATGHESPAYMTLTGITFLRTARIVAWDKGLAARLRMSVEKRNTS